MKTFFKQGWSLQSAHAKAHDFHMKEKCPPVAVSLYKQAGNKELSSSEC
jgi:hypothetical protein